MDIGKEEKEITFEPLEAPAEPEREVPTAPDKIIPAPDRELEPV